MLTRQGKEQKVLSLYNEGKTIREIVKEVRMSFRYIGAILKKASGEWRKNKTSKNHCLCPIKHIASFLGKTPLQVTITLNLSEEETTKYYQEYLKLTQMHDLRKSGRRDRSRHWTFPKVI